MLKTRVQNDTKRKLNTGLMTNVLEKFNMSDFDSQEIETPQTLTKIMFIGLTITSVVLFYLAISSLML